MSWLVFWAVWLFLLPFAALAGPLGCTVFLVIAQGRHLAAYVAGARKRWTACDLSDPIIAGNRYRLRSTWHPAGSSMKIVRNRYGPCPKSASTPSCGRSQQPCTSDHQNIRATSVLPRPACKCAQYAPAAFKVDLNIHIMTFLPSSPLWARLQSGLGRTGAHISGGVARFTKVAGQAALCPSAALAFLRASFLSGLQRRSWVGTLSFPCRLS